MTSEDKPLLTLILIDVSLFDSNYDVIILLCLACTLECLVPSTLEVRDRDSRHCTYIESINLVLSAVLIE
jgi:hypothetical protein